MFQLYNSIKGQNPSKSPTPPGPSRFGSASHWLGAKRQLFVLGTVSFSEKNGVVQGLSGTPFWELHVTSSDALVSTSFLLLLVRPLLLVAMHLFNMDHEVPNHSPTLGHGTRA